MGLFSGGGRLVLGAGTEGVLGRPGLLVRSWGLSVLVERAVKRTAQKVGESAF